MLSVAGQPHPAVADMLHTLSRSDRTLEGRWWRRDRGGEMTRFAVSRRADRHVIAVRHGELVALQRVASKVGLVSMVTAVLGSGEPAEVELRRRWQPHSPSAGRPNSWDSSTSALPRHGTHAALIDQPALVGDHRRPAASRRHGETTPRSPRACSTALGGGCVNNPRRVNGELMEVSSSSDTNLARALDGFAGISAL